MRDQLRCAARRVKSAMGLHWFVILIALQSPGAAGQLTVPDDRRLPLRSGEVFAQAGSTGGSVGKQDKSISGGQEESARPRSTNRETPTPKRKEVRPEPRGGLLVFDGTWIGLSTGTCIPNYSWTIQIANGVMSGNGVNGQIARGGHGSGVMTVMGTGYIFDGHFGSTISSGVWRTLAGCAGKWTAQKS